MGLLGENGQLQYIGVHVEGKAGEEPKPTRAVKFPFSPHRIFLWAYPQRLPGTVSEHEVGWGVGERKEGTITKKCILISKEETSNKSK